MKYKYTLFLSWGAESKQVELESEKATHLNDEGFFVFTVGDADVFINKNHIVQYNEEVLNG